jgi:glyoxylase-like metal-dependent hydrolase (beta-lactamase superfamily II)
MRYTIHPLPVGVNETDQGIMTYQQHYGQRIWLPIYAFYLEGGPQRILVDTGLERFMVPAGAEQALGFRVLQFEQALEGVGLRPEDVDIIIHTHLHNDHCENDYRCPNARIFVQRAEHDFFRNPHPLDHRYYPDLLDDVQGLVILQGDAQIVDGVRVVLTPGHTPGGQSVVVDTSAGRAVITGFCCNERNFPKKGKPVPSGVHTDAIQAYESAQRVVNEADLVIPLHDSTLGTRRCIPE